MAATTAAAGAGGAAAAGRSLLLLGATGKAGRAVLAQALDRGWAVTAFVRDAARLPQGASADARVRVIVGDATSAADVARAVAAARPAGVVDATSVVPFGHARGAPRNNADRSKLLPALTAALASEGLLAGAALVVVSGFVMPERDSAPPTLFARAINALIYAAAGPAAYAAGKRAMDDLWETGEPGFRFTVLRPAAMAEGPPRGRLRLDSTDPAAGLYPRGEVAYADVAAAALDCLDGPHAFDRRGAYLNYA